MIDCFITSAVLKFLLQSFRLIFVFENLKSVTMERGRFPYLKRITKELKVTDFCHFTELTLRSCPPFYTGPKTSGVT